MSSLRKRLRSAVRPIKKRALQQFVRPRVGHVDLGDLRRLKPISSAWGADRGRVIDRYYIEGFLERHASDVRGHVLEIGTSAYTRRFGAQKVLKSDVLHVAHARSDVTIVDDLTVASKIESETFDCIIFTQTLQFIYQCSATIQTLHRILKKGGVVLATFPGITKISRVDMEKWGHFWGFTSCSARTMFGESFETSDIEVETYGNVLTATAFLYGLSADELAPEELDYVDPDYEVIVSVRARRAM